MTVDVCMVSWYAYSRFDDIELNVEFVRLSLFLLCQCLNSTKNRLKTPFVRTGHILSFFELISSMLLLRSFACFLFYIFYSSLLCTFNTISNNDTITNNDTTTNKNIKKHFFVVENLQIQSWIVKGSLQWYILRNKQT